MIAMWFLPLVPLSCLLGWFFYEVVWKAITSPVGRLPGPRTKGLLKNHIHLTNNPRLSSRAHDEWYRRFGPNMRIKGFNWFDNRLLTLDPKTINYIMNRPLEFEKPWLTQRLLASYIGAGLLASEGAHNRRQRKVINPAFASSNLRRLTPVFFSKAFELRDKWRSLISSPYEGAEIDVTHWLSRATFDVIGRAGFGYEFNAIEEESERIYLTYKRMFDNTANKGESNFMLMFKTYPWLKRIYRPSGVKLIDQSQQTIHEFGAQLLEQRKQEYHDGNTDRIDILSLLVRSNLSPDIPDSQRIRDVDILNQINTFLFAGSDTTSLAVGWTLHLLSEKSELQTRLRNELRTLAEESQPSEEDLLSNSDSDSAIASTSKADNHDHDHDYGYAYSYGLADTFITLIDKLPFLDSVCRESLRLIPPVHATIRVATKDDIIPISEPLKYERTRWRRETRVVEQEGIYIRKGEYIHIPIEGMNLAKQVWGEDAHEFNPDRWSDLPATVQESPGLYSNLMTFGTGPRACIGMRFSIMEMKTMLYALILGFRFESVVEIRKTNVMLTRPFVKDRVREGPQLPLRVFPL